MADRVFAHYGIPTTLRSGSGRQAPDLVERQFQVSGPNQLWVADITYIPTWAGFVYLAIVLDAWSRTIVGWAIATQLRTELVLDALQMATSQRKPEEVIHHSDQGCQYTSIAFGQRCRELGVRPSIGSVGDAYDNAMAESFFATLECELLDRRRFQTQAEAKLGSRVGTTCDAATRRSAICRRGSSSGGRQGGEPGGSAPRTPRLRLRAQKPRKVLDSKALNRPRKSGNFSTHRSLRLEPNQISHQVPGHCVNRHRIQSIDGSANKSRSEVEERQRAHRAHSGGLVPNPSREAQPCSAS